MSESSHSRPDWPADEHSAEERKAFVELVIDHYQLHFGDTLTPEQVLASDEVASVVLLERHGRIIAGIKCSSLANSFTAECVGQERLAAILGDVNPATVVEVSKVVNVGGTVPATCLLARSRRWLRQHATNGFAGLGPRRHIRLYRWVVNYAFKGHWDVSIHRIEEPCIPMQADLELAFLYAKPRRVTKTREVDNTRALPCG